MDGRWFLKRKKNRSKDSHQLNGSAFSRSLGSENRICYCQSWFGPFLNFSVCKYANPLGWKQLNHRRPNSRDGVNNNNKDNKSLVRAGDVGTCISLRFNGTHVDGVVCQRLGISLLPIKTTWKQENVPFSGLRLLRSNATVTLQLQRHHLVFGFDSEWQHAVRNELICPV